jgi:hypothetical protein
MRNLKGTRQDQHMVLAYGVLRVRAAAVDNHENIF